MLLKTYRIAPGESNTWYIRVLGMNKSAFFSTKQPRQWQWMDYEGGRQSWQTEDLGYDSLFPTITGKIFEFGFIDAIQQMWRPLSTNSQATRPTASIAQRRTKPQRTMPC